MCVTVQANLMACIYDLTDLFGERLGGMRRCKPGGLDLVLVPELEKSIDAHGCTENTARYIGWVCRRAGLGVEPDSSVSRL